MIIQDAIVRFLNNAEKQGLQRGVQAQDPLGEVGHFLVADGLIAGLVKLPPAVQAEESFR
ncbi:hypothetical protein D3C85_930480 [compost metagenome]